MEEEKKKHLGWLPIVVLILTGGIADLLSLIPFVGDAVGPIFWACAAIYFWKAGFGFVNGKRLVTGAISTIAELIPAVQELPTIFIGIIVVIIMMLVEEKTGISVTSIASGKMPLNLNGIRQAPQRRPANVDGERQPTGEDAQEQSEQESVGQNRANQRPLVDGIRDSNTTEGLRALEDWQNAVDSDPIRSVQMKQSLAANLLGSTSNKKISGEEKVRTKRINDAYNRWEKAASSDNGGIPKLTNNEPLSNS